MPVNAIHFKPTHVIVVIITFRNCVGFMKGHLPTTLIKGFHHCKMYFTALKSLFLFFITHLIYDPSASRTPTCVVLELSDHFHCIPISIIQIYHSPKHISCNNTDILSFKLTSHTCNPQVQVRWGTNCSYHNHRETVSKILNNFTICDSTQLFNCLKKLHTHYGKINK